MVAGVGRWNDFSNSKSFLGQRPQCPTLVRKRRQGVSFCHSSYVEIVESKLECLRGSVTIAWEVGGYSGTCSLIERSNSRYHFFCTLLLEIQYAMRGANIQAAKMHIFEQRKSVIFEQQDANIRAAEGANI